MGERAKVWVSAGIVVFALVASVFGPPRPVVVIGVLALGVAVLFGM
ncbi:MAG: hypothetical protein ABWY11_12335 [Umezawaea sp.]